MTGIQPSLVINAVIEPVGIYPPRDGASPHSNYVGSVRMFAGAPYVVPGSQADGQLLSISGNAALFSLLGTIYGGDGRTNFAVPDLRGWTMLGSGQGLRLTDRSVGEQVGQPTSTLLESKMPSHTHSLPYPAPDDVAGAAGVTCPHEWNQ